MKMIPALIALVVLLVFLPGCSTPPSKGDDTTIVQSALSAVLPKTHTGYAKFSHRNQFFEIEVEADGLRLTETGWAWQWLRYNRKSNFPIFSGYNWSSNGSVELGRKE